MKISMFRAAAITCMLALFSFGLAADTIEATFVNVSPTRTINYNVTGVGTGSVNAGVHNFNVTGGDFPLDPLPEGASIWAFCIELTQNAGSGTYNVEELEDGRTPGDPLGVVRANMLRSLFAFAFSSNGGYISAITNNAAGQTFAAALQVAVWEIAYESLANFGALSASNGIAQFSNHAATITQANAFLTGAMANYQDGIFATDMFAMNRVGAGQDFLFQVVPGAAEEVPEPATLGLMGLGLLGLAFLRRKQNA